MDGYCFGSCVDGCVIGSGSIMMNYKVEYFVCYEVFVVVLGWMLCVVCGVDWSVLLGL